jgi:hypothetical protein
MKKAISLLSWMIILVFTISLISCEGRSGRQGPGDQEETQQQSDQEVDEDVRQKVLEQVQQKMKEAEESIDVMDANAAYELALKEANKWNKDAKLYYLEGEDDIREDGSAKQWTAYFALREDPQNTPGREQGEKLVVLMLDARVMDVEEKTDPEDIAYTQDCYQFLPEDWMDSKSAYEKCIDVLKTEYGDEVDNGESRRLVCRPAEYYISRKWIIKPTWELSYKMGDIYASAKIHAVTGEVLEIK